MVGALGGKEMGDQSTPVNRRFTSGRGSSGRSGVGFLTTTFASSYQAPQPVPVSTHVFQSIPNHSLSSKMAAPEVQVSRLELAARALDLTSALLNATSSSSAILKGAWEIGQWLGRERLNQYELLDCMEKSKGLAFANKNGRQFFDQVICGLETRPAGPLYLQQSGSLGRLMAGDPNLSWIVSTVASLFQHHRDDRLVTEKVTSFIMASNREEGTPLGADASIYTSEHNRVRVVVGKIVSSVWYNVVNAGCDTVTIPQQLLDLCPRGHYLDPDDFGRAVSTIHAHCPSKAILRANHFLRDVFLWLLLHYDGTLVVTVGGHIVFSTNLGNPQRELEFHIASACAPAGGCDGPKWEPYTILRHVSGKFSELFSGASFSEFSDLPTRPGVRQKLYDIPRLYPHDSPMWNKGSQIMVKLAAQSIMRWLLNIPLSPQTSFPFVGFDAAPGGQATAGQATVSTVLQKAPAMVSLQLGSAPPAQVIFAEQKDVDATDKTDWDTASLLLVLLRFFPALADVERKASVDCLCPDCSRTVDADMLVAYPKLKPGCLRRTALEEVLLLLAHGIADGFGVDNTASVLEVEPIVRGTAVLLVELAVEKFVAWDTWFSLASSVYLGCPFESPVPDTHPAFGGTSFVAIQFGSLATQALWLNLTREITVERCFGLIVCKGRLGVAAGDGSHGARFRGVEENFAIIESENVEDTTSFCSRHGKPASTLDHRFRPEDDDSVLDSDVILYQTEGIFYRLLFRVKAKSHWRGVDPSDAMSAVIRMLPSAAACNHHGGGGQPVETTAPFQAKTYKMDEVVGRWPDEPQVYVPTSTTTTSGSEDRERGDNVFFVTNVLDTHLKKNVALALSVSRVAVPYYPENVCISCAVRHARNAQREPLRKGEGGSPNDRFIISLKTQLTRRRDGMIRIGY